MAKKNSAPQKNVKKKTKDTRSTKLRIFFLIMALIMALGLVLPLFLR